MKGRGYNGTRGSPQGLNLNKPQQLLAQQIKSSYIQKEVPSTLKKKPIRK